MDQMFQVCRYWEINPADWEQIRPALRSAMIDYAVRDSREQARQARRAARKR